MNIIIDGYNLLKQVLKRTTASDVDRQSFIKKLADYASYKKHSIYIIFDGGSYVRPTAEKYQGRSDTYVVYSGIKESADDVIKRYIDEQLLSSMLIVSTDRQITAYALRHHVPTIDSLDFYSFVIKPREAKAGLRKAEGQAHKLHEEHTSIDELMQEASEMLYVKDVDSERDYKSTKTQSKKEKRIESILKKL